MGHKLMTPRATTSPAITPQSAKVANLIMLPTMQRFAPAPVISRASFLVTAAAFDDLGRHVAVG
jgi:hypothetical protein